MQVLTEAVAELEDRAQQRVDDAMRPLRVELAELKISNCELRITNTRLREQLTSNGHADSAGFSSSLN
jgi:regulator of replication initiation timing